VWQSLDSTAMRAAGARGVGQCGLLDDERLETTGWAEMVENAKDVGEKDPPTHISIRAGMLILDVDEKLNQGVDLRAERDGGAIGLAEEQENGGLAGTEHASHFKLCLMIGELPLCHRH